MKNALKGIQASLMLLILLSLSVITGCSSDDNDGSSSGSSEIIVSKDELKFSKQAGTQDLAIKTSAKVEVISGAEWCTVTKQESTSSTTLKYQVAVTENTTTSDRETAITVKGNGNEKTVKVIQSAADGLVVEKDTYTDIPAAGGTIDVKLTTNTDVEVSINDKWITEGSRAAMAEKTLTFIIEQNYGSSPRTGTITLKAGDATATITVTQKGAETVSAGMESDAKTLAAKIFAGWNIGNTLEATGGETAWGNPMVTADLIQKVKAMGFNAVRIPCSWDQYIDDRDTHKLKESWLNRVDEVVGYCVANDMYAIVNIHWDGGWLENNCTADKQAENNEKQKALWTQIANKLNHYDEHLLFAGCNEPNVDNADQMAVLKTYEQTFIDAVRATGGNNAVRNLIVQGPGTDIDKTEKFFSLPTDQVANRLMVEVHYYSPWTFCGMEKDESWGKMAYFWDKYEVSGSDRNAGKEYGASYVASQFQKMKEMFVDKGIPVILGEYGAMVRTGLGKNQEAHDKSRGYFNEVVTREAKNHGMVPFYWDGGTYAMINRATGTVNDQYVFDGIMAGAEAGKYPF
ncbi:cellulase family glycosylhydrolase [uncultured Bacteroides sp.]|uniref:cellulase family glycosylhydrolase n=1 Tax=uncultured Bacteroides sp. TaxID=162156 RepID=UPI002622CA05|nr:cellulase family glycosylhydrolase [uncultured Bacteroides sp.]